VKRLLAFLVLVALAFGVYYYWKTGSSPVTQGQIASVNETVDAVGAKLRSTKIAGSVKAALELNRSLATHPIDVSAEGDVVVLKGEVPNEETRALAGRVAGNVPEVGQVRNELRVNGALPPAAPAGEGRTIGENLDDQAVEAKVRLAFSLNKELKGTDISVKSYRKTVTLQGDVGTEAQHQAAVLAARETFGVAGVTDQLRVGGAGAPAAAPVGAPTAATAAGASGPPGSVARAVEQALAASPSLAAYGLKAREEGGRVVLTGVVRTAAERELALATARGSAHGPIDNAIEIRP
jgi:hyperosmotically inducible periplasmic protein